MKKLIRLLLIILTLGCLVFFGIKKSTKPVNQCVSLLTKAIGNRLSGYFYYIHTFDASDKKLAKEKSCNAKCSNLELSGFYKKLNWKRQPISINYHSIEPESAWHSINDDHSEKVNYLNFWQTLRSSVRDTYDKDLPKIEVEYPVVHFRCSDAPFMKHRHYHLTKVASVKWMIEKIKERGFSKIILLNCNSHRTLDQNSCSKYVEFYSNIFKNSGIEVEQQCDSILKDFSMMVHAPLLISMNTSSFSFMAGISKNPNDYISCNMGAEIDEQYFLQTQADWILDQRAPLLHKDVHDYNNVDDVLHKLDK